MTTPRGLVVALFFLCASAGAWGEVLFAPADWALQAAFPVEPKTDDQRTPSPQGDQVAERRFLDSGTDRLMLIRFVYPMVPPITERGSLYKQSVEAMMNSRPGVMHTDEILTLGEHKGMRLVIEQTREKTFREVQLVQIGASLYVASAEWAGGAAPSPVARRFLESLAVQPGFASARVVEDRERFRAIVFGNFTLRYDASRWFRDPEATEPNVAVLLRIDEMAEAEFMGSRERNPAATMEETVLATAREHAESVKVVRRGKKLRGSTTVEELRFAVRSEGVTYENHGYFYSGSEGTVQLRAWSPDRTFKRVEGDISELLDGLSITRGVAAAR
ncbi:MAG: hypothetical protein C0518_11915 [Opitutus sp.]|nr:hypothetical protein [Opitutus sp.]